MAGPTKFVGETREGVVFVRGEKGRKALRERVERSGEGEGGEAGGKGKRNCVWVVGVKGFDEGPRGMQRYLLDIL